MSNLFIQMHLGAISKADSAYVAAGLENQNALLGGLIRLWAACWARKSLHTSPMQVCAFFYRNHRDQAGSTLMEALIEYGFLIINPDSTLMVRDDKDRLGITKSANRAKGAEKSRAKKNEAALKPTKPNAKTRNQAPINVDAALMHDEHAVHTKLASTLMQAPIYSETHRLIEDHNLLGGSAREIIKPDQKPISQRTQGLAAEVITPAQPPVNEPRGDHAAREAKTHRDDMTSASDLARRAFKAFSRASGDPPQESSTRPLAASPTNEPNRPDARHGNATAPPISQPRPPETKQAKPADATTETGDFNVFGP